MDSVEAITAPVTDSGVISTTDTTQASVSDDNALSAVYQRLTCDNGSARGDDGKFVSANPGADTGDPAASADTGNGGPLEGGEGEAGAAVEPSTPAVTVPLPATMTGLDEHWGKLPPEAQEAIAANQKKLHDTVSNQGRALAAYKPIADVLGEYKEYFGGTRGNHNPVEAMQYLFNMQKAFDNNPLETLIEVAEAYELRGELQKMFGGAAPVDGQQPQQTDHTQALLAEIGRLNKKIEGLADPSKIDERITTKLNEDRTMNAVSDVISRTSKDMPLYGDVEEQLPTFIQMSWRKLGDTASQEAVLKHAYDMAVNADPDLRKKAAALTSAASPEAAKVEAARKANATNIRSTTVGKPREPTEDELLQQAYRKAQRA